MSKINDTNIKSFTLDEIEQVLPLKSWWAMLLVLPVVRRLTLLTVNHTSLTPNQITIASILLRLLTAWCFLHGTHAFLIYGAIAFYLSYVLDCMDGAVARLRKLSSEFGRYLDHLGDLIGGIVAVAALAYGQGMLVSPLIAGLLFCHVAEYYISYLTSTLLQTQQAQVVNDDGRKTLGLLSLYLVYRHFFHKQNIKSFFSFPDYEAMVFLLFPLLGLPVLGLKIGFCLALIVTLYTIFSSFVAINTGGNQFP
jgi:phosphatidylglycerophosphate synthase